ncbi:MAG: hypothetical protein IT280_06175 [Ignavibacteria bacterium]|nr:hypothetical protein [Ignavibacteria bacterium]
MKPKFTQAHPFAYVLAFFLLLIPVVNLFFWLPVVLFRRPCDYPSEF